MITGYIVMAVLAIVFLSISSIIANKFSGEGVDDFVAGGRKVTFWSGNIKCHGVMAVGDYGHRIF